MLPLASTSKSHAVPTCWFFLLSPQRPFHTNLVGWATPSTVTRKFAFFSGYGKGVNKALGFSKRSDWQSSCDEPLSVAQSAMTEEIRLLCTKSTTTVTTGAPSVIAAVGSMRRMRAMGAASAGEAIKSRAARQVNAKQRNRFRIGFSPRRTRGCMSVTPVAGLIRIYRVTNRTAALYPPNRIRSPSCSSTEP